MFHPGHLFDLLLMNHPISGLLVLSAILFSAKNTWNSADNCAQLQLQFGLSAAEYILLHPAYRD